MSRSGDRRRRAAGEAVDRAWRALEENRLDTALRAARRAVAMDPADPEAAYALGCVLLEAGDPRAAARTLAKAADALADDGEFAVDYGYALFLLARFDDAEPWLAKAASSDVPLPEVWFALGICRERLGRADEAAPAFDRTHSLDPERYPRPCRVDPGELERVAADALAELPPEIGERIAGVPVQVEDWPDAAIVRDSGGDLDPMILGLFEGVPFPDQVHGAGGGPVLPERIVLYRRNLELTCGCAEEMRKQVRITLFHEIGHWLGLDELDLDHRGLA